MKTGTVLVAALALASFPLVAQQSSPDNQPSSSPSMQQSNPPEQQTSPPAEQPRGAPAARPDTPPSSEASAVPAAPAAEMRPVSGLLVSKLDSKTAKTGDDVVVQTKASVKTADGTEIPEGSKLVGHVIAVQASTGGQNSQVALQFDHAELQGGQNVPIQSQIQSIGSAQAPSGASGAMSEPSMAGGSATPSASAAPERGMSGAGASNAGTAPGYTPSPSSAPTAAASGAPTAGTVVARNGKIAIRTTSIPDVLLANNEPGQQDPRMAQASSILLGARKDVQLEGGTPMVLGVAATSGGAATK
jgi:hypothetical protein